MRWGRLAAAAACAAASGGSAHAAPPIEVGAGEQPDVTVAANGTAHVVWNSADNSVVRYCRLAATATRCSRVQELRPGDVGLSRPYVFVADRTVRILTNRCCTGGARTLLYTSNDGGATFGAPAQVGNVDPAGDAAAGPGAGISTVTSHASSTYYQRVPADGSAPATASALLSSDYRYNGTVGFHQGRPVVAFDDLASTAFTIGNGADPNSGANWSAPTVVGAGTQPHLADGPSGLFLLLTREDGGLDLRRLDGTSFVAAAGFPVATSSGSALAQDAGGVLHGIAVSTANGVQLVHAQSTDAGASWSNAQPIVDAAGFQGLRIAAGPNGRGVAVWNTGGGAGAIQAARFPPEAAGGDPPVARFTWSPPSPCSSYPLTLNGSGSTGGNAIRAYRWEVEPFQVAQPTRVYTSDKPITTIYVPAHSSREEVELVLGRAYRTIRYERPPVTVGLRVTDTAGRTATTSHKVEFRNPVTFIRIPTFVIPGHTRATTEDSRCRRVIGPPTMRFNTASVRVKSTSVLVGLRCPGGTATCLGLATARRPGGARAGARRVRLARSAAAFSIPPGAKRTVAIKLRGRERRLLRQRKLRRVRTQVAFVSKDRKVKLATKTLRVRYRKR